VFGSALQPCLDPTATSLWWMLRELDRIALQSYLSFSLVVDFFITSAHAQQHNRDKLHTSSHGWPAMLR
jgi:hypothetical protein